MRRTLRSLPLAVAGALVCVTWAGCSGVRATPAAASSRATVVAGASAAPSIPSQPPAEYYATAVAPAWTPDPLGAQVNAEIDALRRRRGLPPMVRDGRLDRAAYDVALLTVDMKMPPFHVLTALLAHYGIVEPEPSLFALGGDDGAEAAAVANLERQIGTASSSSSWRRIGIGVRRSPGKWLAVLVVHDKSLDLEPLPRRLPANGQGNVNGQIRAGYRAPEVLVTPPAGPVRKLAASVRDGTFSATMDCGQGAGAYQLEVMAEDARGPTVLANFPVYCGVEPPLPNVVGIAATAREVDPVAAERRIFELLNEDRRKRGLPALGWDAKLTEVARAYSREMAETGEVAHVSPRTGGVADRLRVAGFRPPYTVGENVALGASPDDVQRGFMESPGHRKNLLSPSFSHVGIGAAIGRDGDAVLLYVTQIFMGWGP